MRKEEYYSEATDKIIEEYPLGRDYMPKDFIERNGYWVSPIDNANMLLVVGGPSIIGNDNKHVYKDENPAHTVYLDPFLIDVHKVRRESYQTFLDALRQEGGHSPKWCHIDEPYHKNHIPGNWHKQMESPSLAVHDIDWYDAWAYARWAQKSLPTEAQWEKACSPQFVFPLNERRDHNLYTLQNILGKGWEWCLDWYRSDYHRESPRYEPCCIEKTGSKVTKGCIHNAALPLIRISFRNRYPVEHREETLGFRCVYKLPLLSRQNAQAVS